jgi:hypothetical protein
MLGRNDPLSLSTNPCVGLSPTHSGHLIRGVAAHVVLNALRPDDPVTGALLERARQHMQRGVPFEVSPDDTVDVFFVADDWDAGAGRVAAAFDAAAIELRVHWPDFFTFVDPLSIE